MPNPYQVLNAAFDDGDEVIRRRYLERVRQFPPDRCPDDFQRVREAYERIKDEDSRLAFLLFEPSQGETLEELLAEERCRKQGNRPGLQTLLSLLSETR